MIDKNKIISDLERALKWQFSDGYSWEDFIEDVAMLENWSEEEKNWAKEHTSFGVKVDEADSCDCNANAIEVSDGEKCVVFCPKCMKVLSWFGDENDDL